MYRQCKHCKTPLVGELRHNKHYCSHECWKAAHIEQRQCAVCGSTFSIARYLRTRYCSAKCAAQPRKRNCPPATCPCGNVFIGRSGRTFKYCSVACFRKYAIRNIQRKGAEARKKLKTLVCEQCGNTESYYGETKSRRFCSRKCWDDFQRTNLKKVRTGVVAQRRLARAYYGNRCNRCGYDSVPEILQLHHRDHNRFNGTIENIELLCPNCHEEEHFRLKTGRFDVRPRKRKPIEQTYKYAKLFT